MNSANQRFTLPREIRQIGEAVRDAGGRPVLVGGWVRDYLLGQPHGKDFDLEVFGLDPLKLKKLLTRFGPVHEVGRHFGVLKLITREADYDVSVPRRETKTGKGHKGFRVEPDPGMSFAEAARRRDFTINAMGYAFLEDDFLDPCGGEAHLRERMLRHVGPAFGEDPLRVMRAMQFAGRFALTIAPETLAICREQDLRELPRERMWEEFRKLLLRSPAPSRGLEYAEALGILKAFPELAKLAAAQKDGPAPWAATMATVDHAARLREGEGRDELALMLAALCLEFGRPAPPAPDGAAAAKARAPVERPVRKFLARLTNEAALVKAVVTLVREAPQPGLLFAGQTGRVDGGVRRLALRVSIPLLERLARARHYALNYALNDAPHPADAEREEYPAGAWLLERAEALGVLGGPPQPLLKGRHLQGEGFPSGPAMGILLKQAFELQLDGELASPEEALNWAREAARRKPADAAPGEP